MPTPPISTSEHFNEAALDTLVRDLVYAILPAAPLAEVMARDITVSGRTITYTWRLTSGKVFEAAARTRGTYVESAYGVRQRTADRAGHARVLRPRTPTAAADDRA